MIELLERKRAPSLRDEREVRIRIFKVRARAFHRHAHFERKL